jgi:hypothetical protein
MRLHRSAMPFWILVPLAQPRSSAVGFSNAISKLTVVGSERNTAHVIASSIWHRLAAGNA